MKEIRVTPNTDTHDIKLNHVGLLGRFKVIIKYRYRYSLGGKLYSLFGNLLLLSNIGNKGVK